MAGAVVAFALLAFAISAVRSNLGDNHPGSDQYLIDQAEASVRAKLRDPASAIFSEERIVGTGPDRRVCGFVNAKNGFGGYSGNQRFVSFMGTLAYIGDEQPLEAIWSRPEHPCDVF